MRRDVCALVPVKRTSGAKQRLSDALSSADRQRLALLMLEDVLDALSAMEALAGVAVVTADQDVARIAAARGVRVIHDALETSHTEAVRQGIGVLQEEGCRAVLTLPGDIPLVTPAEIASLVEAASGEPSFVIAPAHDGRGSNAILLAPPDIVPLRFGDDSFLPHLAACRARGIEPKILRLAGIGRDIDTPEDIAALLAAPSETRSRTFLAAREGDMSIAARSAAR